MDEFKDIRWKQRFENFNKSYTLLDSMMVISFPSSTPEAQEIIILNFVRRINFGY